MNPPSPNSYWIKPGQFAAGEYPGDLSPLEAKRKVKNLLDSGINHFIDLTESAELEPYRRILEKEALSLGLSVEWERHPIKDMCVPRDPEQMTNILDSIDEALHSSKVVCIHCWGGVGRTGTVAGCWLVRHGLSGEDALHQVAEWWQGVGKSRRLPRSPETHRQREYVRNWHET